MRYTTTILLVCALTTGCVRRFAMNRVADALASGGSTFQSDNDLQLVGDALPFGLKMYESLLAENPKHKGLLLTTCQGFASYAYVFVSSEADRVADVDLARAKPMQDRARNLYLRALGYCQRSIEVAYPGFGAKLVSDPAAAAAMARRKDDVPSLYWTAVSLGLAISISKHDAAMLARLPEVEALVERGLHMDEAWDDGALHEFRVLLAGAKPGAPDFAAIDRHYKRALELSKGSRASVYVSWAEVAAVPRQDRAGFRAALDKALAVEVDRYPLIRLPNLASQRRAAWLLGRIDDIIRPPAEEIKQ